MKRRNLLIGFGGLAGAGGIAGTGAFTSITANRGVTVAVAADDQGLIRLEPSSTVYGEKFARQNGNGLLELDFGDNGRGDGLGTDSEYEFDDVFTVTNQGTRSVYVWGTFETSAFGNGSIHLYPGSDSGTNLTDGGESVVELGVGETLHTGVHIDTTGVEFGKATVKGTIHADAVRPTDSTAVSPGDDPPTTSLVTQYPPVGDSDTDGWDVMGGPSQVTGKTGHALQFDGEDDVVSKSIDRETEATVSLWAYYPSGVYNEEYSSVFASSTDSSTPHSFQIDTDGGLDPRWRFHGANETLETRTIGPVARDEWEHLAVTVGGGTVRAYQNGTEQLEISDSAAQVATLTEVFIGRNRNGWEYFEGRIDDVRIYDRVYTPSEIEGLYDAW